MHDISSKLQAVVAEPHTAGHKNLPWAAWFSIVYCFLFVVNYAFYILGLSLFPIILLFGDAWPLVFMLATVIMPFIGAWGIWKSRRLWCMLLCGLAIFLSLLSALLTFGLFMILLTPQH